MRSTAEALTLDRRSLLDAALDAIISIDAAGRVLEFNPSAERTFGWSAQEAIGRPVEELIIPERLRAAHLAGVMRVANGGATRIAGRRVPVDARRRDGSEFPAELTITLTSAEPFIATAFVRDLTDRRRLEDRPVSGCVLITQLTCGRELSLAGRGRSVPRNRCSQARRTAFFRFGLRNPR